MPIVRQHTDNGRDYVSLCPGLLRFQLFFCAINIICGIIINTDIWDTFTKEMGHQLLGWSYPLQPKLWQSHPKSSLDAARMVEVFPVPGGPQNSKLGSWRKNYHTRLVTFLNSHRINQTVSVVNQLQTCVNVHVSTGIYSHLPLPKISSILLPPRLEKQLHPHTLACCEVMVGNEVRKGRSSLFRAGA